MLKGTREKQQGKARKKMGKKRIGELKGQGKKGKKSNDENM